MGTWGDKFCALVDSRSSPLFFSGESSETRARENHLEETRRAVVPHLRVASFARACVLSRSTIPERNEGLLVYDRCLLDSFDHEREEKRTGGNGTIPFSLFIKVLSYLSDTRSKMVVSQYEMLMLKGQRSFPYLAASFLSKTTHQKKYLLIIKHSTYQFIH